MASLSPTQRSLQLLRDRGYTAEIVERWNVFARKRVDLFGVIDIIAIRPGETLGVQTTTVANQASRLAKIAQSDLAKIWISAGNRLVVHGWGRRKVERGKKKTEWRLTEREV